MEKVRGTRFDRVLGSLSLAGGKDEGPFGFGFEFFDEVFDQFGLSSGEIVEFKGVFFEIVEFPGGVSPDGVAGDYFLPNEFPIARADGGISFVFEDDGARCCGIFLDC